MKKMIYAVMAIASLTYSTHTTAQSQDLQKKVNDYFEQSLQAQQKALEQDGKADYAKNTPLGTELQTAIKNKDIANYQKMVWTAWCEANNALQEEKLIEPAELKLAKNSAWHLPQCLEPNAVMPYYYGKKGVAASGQYPLFLYTHGSARRTENGRMASNWVSASRMRRLSISFRRFRTRANTIAGGICRSSMPSKSLFVWV